MAPYTLLLDAISKAVCATGMRVGWGLMPPAVRRRMADILGHVGAWAPKAEQVATAALLDAPAALRAFQATMKAKVKERLDALHAGFAAMAREGIPVEVIAPQGAIYLSVRFDLFGRTLRGRDDRHQRRHPRASCSRRPGSRSCPSRPSGSRGDTGWFRLSVGAVSMDDIAAASSRGSAS